MSANINILVGGEAGQGLATIGESMARAMTRAGYEVAVCQDYMSRIRGGHNTFAIRTGPDPVLAPAEDIDILVALNQETVDLHLSRLTGRGVLVAGDGLAIPAGTPCLRVPFRTLAPKPLYDNVAALGVLGSAVCGDVAILERLVSEAFAKKGAEVLEANLTVLRAAYAWVKEQDFSFACMPPAPAENAGRLMLHGNEAIALGALAAGCNFVSFYPMTPGTSVVLTLIDKGRETGLVSEQAEDEIAAVNMALGAACAGARALVSTSGGGFALMCEGVSLGGMLELPVVLVVAQRPGPATGLPTRTEQADLNLVLYAGHGEFPRAIFAPGSPEDCFYLTHRAFDLAERYQTPCFVLTDQFLADSYRSVAPFDLDALPEPPELLLSPGEPAAYERYRLTEDGVSPRAIPGFSQALVRADSDEHTEDGRLTEDLAVRVAMQDKRLRKGQGLLEETVPPDYYGPDGPDLLLVCWGSALGAALEARQTLEERGKKVAVLHFRQVWPLDGRQFLPFLESAREIVAVEGNSTGQLAALLRQETGVLLDKRILRYDGLPFTARFILDGLEKLDS
jgi:2-oxoglutarate ferredoxin oxidoreductase subunit alpha